MALLDLFSPKDKKLADKLENKRTGQPSSMPVTMPETIDFTALWSEPDQGGGLAAMLPWINLGILTVLAVKAFF